VRMFGNGLLMLLLAAGVSFGDCVGGFVRVPFRG